MKLDIPFMKKKNPFVRDDQPLLVETSDAEDQEEIKKAEPTCIEDLPEEERTDRARVIFGNIISNKDYEKAKAGKASNIKKYGDDTSLPYHLQAAAAPVVGSRLGVRVLSLSEGTEAFDIAADAKAAIKAAPAKETERTVADAAGRPVVVGNIRMGFGHYRISMALASAARAMGYTPYWFDLCGFPGTTATKLVEGQNKLYSLGSRVSQKVSLVNKFFWEPLNSEGFRQLTYNSGDQKTNELLVALYGDLPKDVPFVAAHCWPAQGAIHAGLTNVVNAIPDNWPMALHLAEGAVHTVQTPSSYLGYKMLRGMAKEPLIPMPAGSLIETGHYIDHELVEGIPADNAARLDRASKGEPIRYLICVGGAGAQFDYIRDLIKHLMPYVQACEATIMVNVGDHKDVWKQLKRAIPELAGAAEYFDDFDEIEGFCQVVGGLKEAPAAEKPKGVMSLFKSSKESSGAQEAGEAPVVRLDGVHAFANDDIFAAVYSTNLLMRVCDVLVTKPSELAFYPVPKMMIRRVGGHEAWGAIRAAEIGDGTYELEDIADACAYVDAVQNDRSLIVDMCDNILAADERGVYDGAYKVIELATMCYR